MSAWGVFLFLLSLPYILVVFVFPYYWVKLMPSEGLSRIFLVPIGLVLIWGFHHLIGDWFAAHKYQLAYDGWFEISQITNQSADFERFPAFMTLFFLVISLRYLYLTSDGVNKERFFERK